MIGITPDKVSTDILATCKLVRFNDHIRSHILDEPDLSGAAAQIGATEYLEARRHVAEALQWKVFSHCASVTRLYALYEGFVYDLISAWLALVPGLYGSYSDLPEAILRQHRVGVGMLLQKYGAGARTEKLTELGIVRPIFGGLDGHGEFELLADAFFFDLRNLRHEELCALFRKASLDGLSDWLQRHRLLAGLCDAAGTTLAARLTELIEFRNEASHARSEIDETLGVSAFQDIADFVRTLCEALHQFVLIKYLDVLETKGRLERLGKLTEYFARREAAILLMHGNRRLRVGEELIVRGNEGCVAAKLAELQDNDRSVEVHDGHAGQEIGIRLSPNVAKKGLLVFRRVTSNESSAGNTASLSIGPMTPSDPALAPKEGTVLESTAISTGITRRSKATSGENRLRRVMNWIMQRSCK